MRLSMPAAVLWRVALLLLATVLTIAPATAQTFPKFTGLVVDAANVLPPETKAALTQKLEALQKDTKRQLVVATIPDLQGYPIEDYGYKLGRAWGVGLRDVNNGAILIVAPNQRKVRVEVGRGLEPIVTDALSSVIINQDVIPRFKTGDMPGGITAGVDALAQQLSASPEEQQARLDAATKQFDQIHQRYAVRPHHLGGHPALRPDPADPRTSPQCGALGPALRRWWRQRAADRPVGHRQRDRPVVARSRWLGR